MREALEKSLKKGFPGDRPFDESKVRRHPKGSRLGGRFAPKGGAAAQGSAEGVVAPTEERYIPYGYTPQSWKQISATLSAEDWDELCEVLIPKDLLHRWGLRPADISLENLPRILETLKGWAHQLFIAKEVLGNLDLFGRGWFDKERVVRIAVGEAHCLAEGLPVPMLIAYASSPDPRDLQGLHHGRIVPNMPESVQEQLKRACSNFNLDLRAVAVGRLSAEGLKQSDISVMLMWDDDLLQTQLLWWVATADREELVEWLEQAQKAEKKRLRWRDRRDRGKYFNEVYLPSGVPSKVSNLLAKWKSRSELEGR